MAKSARRRRKKRPAFKTEAAAIADGIGLVAGIDEAGMGPWAGPVVAAAVRLVPGHIPKGLDDSKQLSSARRDVCFAAIMASARVGVGIAEVDRIDRDNILAASHWAMAMAIGELGEVPGLALVDGRHAPDLGCPVRAVIGGDGLIVSIAAASIVAKVTRDRLMVAADARYPGYGFASHKGYGTSAHREAIARLGLTPLHRRSFKPIADFESRGLHAGVRRPLTPVAWEPC